MKLIPLTRGKFAKVDDADFECLMQWKWHCVQRPNGDWVAVRNSRPGEFKTRRLVLMHRQLMSAEQGQEIDHRDRDTLNNQKSSNLRIATHAQNQRNGRRYKNNTSGFIGVNWRPKHKKWCARIARDGKMIHVGYFKTKEEAAQARDKAALSAYGEFASLNFLGFAVL